MFFASSDISEHVAHIIIENDVLIGSACHIYVSNHNFESVDKIISLQGHSSVKPVVLKRGCWIGANITILPGVVVGAGCFVTKSVPPHTVFAGNPARIVKTIGNQTNNKILIDFIICVFFYLNKCDIAR